LFSLLSHSKKAADMLNINKKRAIVCGCRRKRYNYAQIYMKYNVEIIFLFVHEIINIERHSCRSGFVEGINTMFNNLGTRENNIHALLHEYIYTATKRNNRPSFINIKIILNDLFLQIYVKEINLAFVAYFFIISYSSALFNFSQSSQSPWDFWSKNIFNECKILWENPTIVEDYNRKG